MAGLCFGLFCRVRFLGGWSFRCLVDLFGGSSGVYGWFGCRLASCAVYMQLSIIHALYAFQETLKRANSQTQTLKRGATRGNLTLSVYNLCPSPPGFLSPSPTLTLDKLFINNILLSLQSYKNITASTSRNTQLQIVNPSTPCLHMRSLHSRTYVYRYSR